MTYERINHADKKVSDMAREICKKYKNEVYIYLDKETNSYVIYAQEKYGMGRLVPVGKFDTKVKNKISELREIIKIYEYSVRWNWSSYIVGTKNVPDEVLNQCIYKTIGKPYQSLYGRGIDLAVLEWKSEDYRKALGMDFKSKLEKELDSMTYEAQEEFLNDLCDLANSFNK